MGSESALHLLSAFSRLGLEISVQTFESRFLIQKNAYFLREFGEDLGYVFGMYISGPYSSALTRDAYSLQDIEYKEEEVNLVSVNTEAIGNMKRFLEDIDQVVPGSKGKKYWLELLASLHFICKYGYRKVKTVNDAKSQSKLAPFGDDVEKAFEILKKHNLIQA